VRGGTWLCIGQNDCERALPALAPRHAAKDAYCTLTPRLSPGDEIDDRRGSAGASVKGAQEAVPNAYFAELNRGRPTRLFDFLCYS